MTRLALLLVALAVVLGCIGPEGALADGDPGSDVLLAQNLFYGYDFPISTAQELRLGRLLEATARVGAPVRVAIIAHKDDLGAIPELWRKPQEYAAYLGQELAATYPGRLLVVMPSGLGFSWDKHLAVSGYAALAGLPAPSGSTVTAMTAATSAAIYALERAAGVSAARLVAIAGHPSSVRVPSAAGGVSAIPPAAETTPTGSGSGPVSGWFVAVLMVAVLIGAFFIRAMWRRRNRLPPSRSWLSGRPTIVVLSAPVVAVLALVIALSHLQTTSRPASTLQNNPDLYAGTALPARPAPNLTLTDETGHRVQLSHYRGKVVILSFVDAECQTICPLETTAILDAKRELGAAGKDVQLIGVNANWRSLQVEDVLTYTQLHGLSGQWHFLTGSLSQLQRVWSAYGVNEYKLLTKKERANVNDIDHEAYTFVIDPRGRLQRLYQTYDSYAAIPQLGQLIAHEASRLLPSHPRVGSHDSYAEVTGIPPSANVTLPRAGGGTIALGPGHPHTYVFFDTWDQQTTPLAAKLEQLNSYAETAKREGLPTPVAVDEASVEPSTAALQRFLRTLPQPLRYPVAIDQTGRVADGYDVQGEPWFVLTDPTGGKAWYQEVYTTGWPSSATLVNEARDALRGINGAAPTEAAATRELKGSPAPLAALHAQSSAILTGGQQALDDRIKALKGYPIVVNVWGSWCEPCQAEFHLFANASAHYGKRVAFLGADSNDSTGDGQQFLNQHHVSYPSYETTRQSIEALIPAGLEGTPTTIYIDPAGKVTVNDGSYSSQGSLDQSIESYALGG